MGLYQDEWIQGDEYITPGRTITETDIVMFAALSGDYNEIHTNTCFAQNTPFEKRIVHGLYILSVCHGLIFRLGLFEKTAIAFLGIENLKFISPVFIGDTIRVKMSVLESRASQSKLDRGLVKFAYKVEKMPTEEAVQTGVKVLMFKRKNNE